MNEVEMVIVPTCIYVEKNSSLDECDSILDVSEVIHHQNCSLLAEALLEIIPENSLVIDLGCGNGYYCEWLEKNGYTVIAIEGTKDINKVSIYRPIFRWNLMRDLILSGLPKDVTVLSFEVGEHIPKEYEDVFINNVTKYAKRVIISWAIPGQGGYAKSGHINEQTNDHIISKMEEKEFRWNKNFTEYLRKAVFDSRLWWFKNTLMYFEK